MNALTIKKLNKIYPNGTQALRDVDLEITQGDFYALFGANGAGKTTMIGIVTGLVNKTNGQVCVFNHDIDREFVQAKQLVGVVPQEMNFNIFEKVQDILVTQAGYFGIPKSAASPTSLRDPTMAFAIPPPDSPTGFGRFVRKAQLMAPAP